MHMRQRDVRFDLSCASGVAIAVGHAEYAANPPFSPGRRYPEYPFANFTVGCERNYAYEMVRETLRLLELDERHYGTTHWNPLGEVVRPGDRVVIKPSFGCDLEDGGASAECLMTHLAVLRAVLDYVHIATSGRGDVIIASAPERGGAGIRRLAGLEDIVRFYRGCAALELQVYDLRPQKRPVAEASPASAARVAGDPAGYVVVSLADEGGGEYLIPRTLLGADVVISVPKLRTDADAGFFGNLENLAQMQGPSERQAGSAVLDLNRVLACADSDGRCHDRPVRRFFSLVDGIVAAEGDCPGDPRPHSAGVMLAGFNPVAVDLACARAAGFDTEKIPTLRQALENHPLPLAHFAPGDVHCRSNLLQYDRPLEDFEGPCMALRPHSDWRGRIEFNRKREEAGTFS